MSRIAWIQWLAAATAVAGIAGCHGGGAAAPGHEPAAATKVHGEIILPDDQPRATTDVAVAQAAAGARADATLHAAHFDGGELNALGRYKLDSMLEDQETAVPLVVYVDVPSDRPIAQARLSVFEYLKGRGVAESNIRLESGVNPHSTSPAADAITALNNLNQSQSPSQQQSQGQGGGYAPTGNTFPGAPTPSGAAGH